MTSPEFSVSPGDAKNFTGIIPVYPLTEGLTQKWMRAFTASADQPGPKVTFTATVAGHRIIGATTGGDYRTHEGSGKADDRAALDEVPAADLVLGVGLDEVEFNRPNVLAGAVE